LRFISAISEALEKLNETAAELGQHGPTTKKR